MRALSGIDIYGEGTEALSIAIKNLRTIETGVHEKGSGFV